MVRGFIFDGVDIDNLGLEYAPEMSQTYVHGGSTIKTHEETNDGADGGYYYGSTVQPKVFQLRCFFEESFINSGITTQIESVFRRGRIGKLVFKERPWCYYIATVTKNVVYDQKNYLNGLVSITLTAYYPFARSDKYYIEGDNDPDKDNLLANSGMLIASATNNGFSAWEPMQNFEKSCTLTEQEIEICNVGTERADVCVAISGDVGDGLVIFNKTSGQSMKIVGLTAANTTNVNKELRVDSLNGKCVLVNTQNNTATNGYIYHDGGFIQLEPTGAVYRNLHVGSVTSGFNQMVSNGSGGYQVQSGFYYNFDNIPENYFDETIGNGEYYLCHNVKLPILKADPANRRVAARSNASALNNAYADICRVNKIVLQPVVPNSESNINVKFMFKPTFA